MSKAVLVIDMPEKCEKCRFYLNSPSVKHLCYIKQQAFDEERPKWCPLKPMPEEKECNGLLDFDDSVAYGFNQCLDKICGADQETN